MDRLRILIFGVATRRAVMDYLRAVGLILFILLAIAWTIDLADNFAPIRADAQAKGVALYELLLPYLTYRTADMVTRMLPMACFFGVFLAEIARRGRLETVIFTAAGASPLRMLVSVLIFGVLVGALQQRLEESWRPAAVAAQVELGHGSYASRFAPNWTRHHAWFLNGDIAIRAQVLRADPPALRDVLIFTGLQEDRLRTIYAADRVDPSDQRFQWHLSGVEIWNAAAGEETSEQAPDQTITIELIPEQLTHYDVPGFYLDTAELQELATMRGIGTSADADTALWRRWTAWLLPGSLALLAVCLTKPGYSGRQINIARLIALAVLGYAAVVSIKVFWAVGELGGLPAPLAVLGSVAVILGLSAVLVWREMRG